MTVEELNAVDMLNDISNTVNKMIEERYKRLLMRICEKLQTILCEKSN